MKKALIVANFHKDAWLNLSDYADCDFYGVDKGCLFFIKRMHLMKLAIGDFDSLSFIPQVGHHAQKVITLKGEKNQTDLEALLKMIVHQYDVIYCWHDGFRQDHFLANVFLLLTFNKLVIMSPYNYAFVLNQSINHLPIMTNYKFVGFFAFAKTQITINNLRYNYQGVMQPHQFFISNEFLPDAKIKPTITISQPSSVVAWYSQD